MTTSSSSPTPEVSHAPASWSRPEAPPINCHRVTPEAHELMSSLKISAPTMKTSTRMPSPARAAPTSKDARTSTRRPSRLRATWRRPVLIVASREPHRLK